MVQGYTLTLNAPDDSNAEVQYPPGAPSVLLASTYAAVPSATSALVGSTKAPVADAAAALSHLSRPPDRAAEAAAAVELKASIESVWQPFSGWHSAKVCLSQKNSVICSHCLDISECFYAWVHAALFGALVLTAFLEIGLQHNQSCGCARSVNFGSLRSTCENFTYLCYSKNLQSIATRCSA